MPFLSTFSAVEANVSLTTTMDNFFVQPLIDVKAISFHSDNNVFCSEVLKNKVKWNFTSKKNKKQPTLCTTLTLDTTLSLC